jgi:anti-sigma regulatory factor (Ser/Thr protein kinase)
MDADDGSETDHSPVRRGRGTPPTDDAVDLGRLTVALGQDAAHLARSALAGWLTDRVSERVLSDANLLVSELVTNSVRHSGERPGAPVEISACAVDGVVRLTVGDDGVDGEITRRRPSSDGSSGMGLNLLDAIATRWGVTHVDGTQVWFELPSQAA